MSYNSLFFFILIIFTSCNTFDKTKFVKDVDGNIYPFIKIGKTYWLQENLKTEHFQNGDTIDIVTDDKKWLSLKSSAMCYYNNDISNKDIYGALYNWYAASDIRNICPIGWEVPSRFDYYELSGLFGGDAVCGQHLKSNTDSLWLDLDSPITNESKFNGIPSGDRDDYKKYTYSRLGFYAFYWTKDDAKNEACSPDSLGCAYECSLSGLFFNQDWGHKKRGMSVRCIKREKAPNKR